MKILYVRNYPFEFSHTITLMRKKKLMNLLVLTVHVCIHHFALSGELWQVWSTMCCGGEECLQGAWSSGTAIIIATAWSRVTTYSRGLLNLFYLNWICCCIKQFCNITNLMKLYFFFLFDLQDIFLEYESRVYKHLVSTIDAEADRAIRKILKIFLKKIYRRKK